MVSVQYMAPEMFQYRLSKKWDVFSFGVLIYEAAHARDLWPRTDDAEVVRRNTQGEHPLFGDHISDEVKDMVNLCRTPECDERPHSKTVIKRCKKVKFSFRETDQYPASDDLPSEEDIVTLYNAAASQHQESVPNTGEDNDDNDQPKEKDSIEEDKPTEQTSMHASDQTTNMQWSGAVAPYGLRLVQHQLPLISLQRHELPSDSDS